MERGHLLLDRNGEQERIFRRANHNRRSTGSVRNAGEDGEVHRGFEGLGDLVRGVADDTDDLVAVGLGAPGHSDVLSDGAIAGEELIGKLLTDDDVVVAGEALLIGEEAAADQGNLDGGEVAGIDGAVDSVVLQIEAGGWPLGDGKDVVAFIAAARWG